MKMAPSASKAEDSWACRNAQLSTLQGLLATPRGRAVFACGGSSTGKRTIVRRAIDGLGESDVVEVDCVVEHTERLLFSSIAGRSVGADIGELVRELSTGNPESASRTVVVLHRAERLVTTGSPFSTTALCALLSLPRLIKRRFALVLLSRLPWPRFRDAAGLDCSAPACVHFSPYTTEQLATALRHMYIAPNGEVLNGIPRETADSLYPGFVQLVTDLLSTITTDLRELHNLSTEMYPRYLAPLNTIDKSKTNAATLPLTLFNTVTAELRGLLQNMHRREYIVHNNKLVPRHAAPKPSHTPKKPTRIRTLADDVDWDKNEENVIDADLSVVARYLLVAGFLAGRNPAKHDMRYFTSERTRRPQKRAKKVSKPANITQAFTLERLLAIFEALREFSGEVEGTEQGSTLSTGGQVQIANLLRLGYITHDSAGDPLADPKYRAHITQPQALAIAKSIRVDLYSYLHIE